MGFIPGGGSRAETFHNGFPLGSGGTDGGAARDILAECVKVAVSAQQCPSSSSDRDAVHSGWLLKKGGGTSKWGRRNWSRRYLAIRQRVLYYYDSDAPGAVPKGSIALSSAEARLAATPHKHAHYFEVACSQSGLVLKLRASSEDERVAWMQALNASAALPSPACRSAPTRPRWSSSSGWRTTASSTTAA